MPWVLWDIVFPLILTFVIGLATGWLLWRWRRRLPQLQVESAPQMQDNSEAGLSEASATVLIEERDEAIARAQAAEQRAAQLAVELDSADIESVTSDAATGAVGNVLADTVQQQPELHEQIQQLEQTIASERTSKAELEQAFMDLTNRQAVLTQKLEDAMDEENSSLVKDAASLQNQYEYAQQQLNESQQNIELMAAQHRQQVQALEDKLVEKESQVERLSSEKQNAQEKLDAIKLARRTGDDKPAPAANVHQLSSYTRSGESVSNESNTVTESVAPDPSAIPATSDARMARVVGLNTAASSAAAIAPANRDEHHDDHAADDDANVEDATVKTTLTATTSENSDANNDASAATPDHADANKPGSSSKKKTANGYMPTAWQVPERTPGKTERDNLQKIRGVGPVLEKLLHKTGIYYFSQVALLDNDGVEELDSQLPQFSGRIARDQWVQQAQSLHTEKYGEPAA
ncbi:MAG: hypothetical protein AAF404_02010 [Pseudomonadota bacterium]